MYVQFNKTKSRDNENADRPYLYQAKSSQSDLRAFLAGAVPATIGNLTNLQTLNLAANSLSGASRSLSSTKHKFLDAISQVSCRSRLSA